MSKVIGFVMVGTNDLDKASVIEFRAPLDAAYATEEPKPLKPATDEIFTMLLFLFFAR